MSHLMADLFAQPQGYGTAAHEQLTEYQKEQRELAVFTVGPTGVSARRTKGRWTDE